MPRQHGCQAPWRAAQVASLFVWFSTVAGFYALEIPMLPTAAWQATTAVLYAVATSAVFCAYFRVSLTDPRDDTADGPLYCEYCQSFVQRGSRHCKECQKCVLGFDHHCKWVNNCIGRKNYRTFMILLTSICAMLTVQLAAGICDLVLCFTAAETVSTQLTAAYPVPISQEGYIAGLCTYLAIVVLALYGLGDLWLLHLVLIGRGLTTYDYIMANHDAAVAAAAGGANAPQSLSVLAASWHKVRSLGPRSGRVQDESVLNQAGSAAGTAHTLYSSRGNGGWSLLQAGAGLTLLSTSSRGLLVLPSKKHRVSLTPCQACLTPQSAIDARQHAVAYQQQTTSMPGSPRGFLPFGRGPAAASPVFKSGAAAFDAAAGSLQPAQEQQGEWQDAGVQWSPLQPQQQQQQQGLVTGAGAVLAEQATRRSQSYTHTVSLRIGQPVAGSQEQQQQQATVGGAGGAVTGSAIEQSPMHTRTRTHTVSFHSTPQQLGPQQQQQQQEGVVHAASEAQPEQLQGHTRARTQVSSWGGSTQQQQQQQQKTDDEGAAAGQPLVNKHLTKPVFAEGRKPAVKFAAEL